MAQQPEGFRREADAHGVTPALPEPAAPPAPDEFIQAVLFFCLAVAVYLLQPVSVVLALSALRDLGFYAWYYTPEFVAVAFGAKGPAQQESLTRLQLWASAAAFPLWFGSAALLAFLPAAYRHAMSVSLGRFARRDDSVSAKGFVAAVAANVLLGVAAWLAIAPVSFGVNYLLGWLHTHYLELTPEEHPLTAAAKASSLRPTEWVLLAFQVMVSAPLWEELFFRGALLALCRKLRFGGHAAMLLALVAALVLRRQQLLDAADDGTRLLLAAVPALFVLAMAPLYAAVCWYSRTDAGPAVFGTALFFAAVHSFAWPTPVALFILGLGLGWLAVRTRSLIAPVVVHSLFNGVSYLLLFFG
jgi:membrane protease YdiL (CAAX protease family)